MAITRKAWLHLGFGTLATVCLLGIVHDGYRLYRITEFNDLLQDGTFARASLEHSPYAAFVQAYAHQQQGDFDASLRAYAAIENVDDARLRSAVQFNMANLHLQRAIAAYNDTEPHVATPLVELAKHSYRDLLRVDSQHWDAKYNLELTLRLLPDVEEQPALAERNPERSPRAAGAVDISRQLP